jgi:hypothetical protein
MLMNYRRLWHWAIAPMALSWTVACVHPSGSNGSADEGAAQEAPVVSEISIPACASMSAAGFCATSSEGTREGFTVEGPQYWTGKALLPTLSEFMYPEDDGDLTAFAAAGTSLDDLCERLASNSMRYGGEVTSDSPLDDLPGAAALLDDDNDELVIESYSEDQVKSFLYGSVIKTLSCTKI